MRSLTAHVAGPCAVVVIVGGALAGCGTAQRAVTPARVSCGSAVTRLLDGRTVLVSAHPGTLPCFDTAARSCSRASITVTTMGVDAGTRYFFAIEANTHPCQVIEQRQFYLVSGGLHHGPVTTAQCRIAAATADGVTLSCSGLQILIPAQLGAPCRPRPGILVCTRSGG